MTRWLKSPKKQSNQQQDKPKRKLPTKAEYDELVPQDPGIFPVSNSDCPGLLGAVSDYLDQAAVIDSCNGGLALALPLLGAIMGRSYRSETDLRTNVYTVALGVSGGGKTSLVKPAKELMLISSAKQWVGNDRIASAPGLLKMLSDFPARVCFLDEYGRMLQQISTPGAGFHANQIITEFTKLYSSANTLYSGTALASRPEDEIDCPHLCVFGLSTPQQFWRAFGSSALEDGSAARYLILPLGDSQPKQPDLSKQDATADQLKKLVQHVNQLSQAVLVPYEAAVEKGFSDLRKTMLACAEYAESNDIKGASPLLRRVAENATKIALISAVGRDQDNPVINQQDFEIGHAIARWSASIMIREIGNNVADNQTERDVNDVEVYIKEAGKKGRSMSDLQRKFRRMPAKYLKDIVTSLDNQEAIKQQEIKPEKGGRPKLHFTAV